MRSLSAYALLVLAASCESPPLAAASSTPVLAQHQQAVCKGDTRGDRRCAHDPTHRVCAEIGQPGTSFWAFTGQSSWCGTSGNYGGQYGDHTRCPLTAPTWCICKWATASWIQGEGCSDNVSIDCAATDICATESGLFFSYDDFDVNLHPARECVAAKCAEQWSACAAANPNFSAAAASSTGTLGGISPAAALPPLAVAAVLVALAIAVRSRRQRGAHRTSPGSPYGRVQDVLTQQPTSLDEPGVRLAPPPQARQAQMKANVAAAASKV